MSATRRNEYIEITRLPAPDPGAPLIWVGGREGMELGSRHVYALSEHGQTRWQAAILWSQGAGAFEESLVWTRGGVALIGGGAELFALDLDTGGVRLRVHIRGYFGHLAVTSDADRVYVLGAQDIVALDADLSIAWIAEGIAVDGIVMKNCDADVIEVEAEMNPPGCWVPVRLHASDGRVVQHGREA